MCVMHVYTYINIYIYICIYTHINIYAGGICTCTYMRNNFPVLVPAAVEVAGTPPGPPPKNPSQAISGCCAFEREEGFPQNIKVWKLV